jgi:hypothetical protein
MTARFVRLQETADIFCRLTQPDAALSMSDYKTLKAKLSAIGFTVNLKPMNNTVLSYSPTSKCLSFTVFL